MIYVNDRKNYNYSIAFNIRPDTTKMYMEIFIKILLMNWKMKDHNNYIKSMN